MSLLEYHGTMENNLALFLHTSSIPMVKLSLIERSSFTSKSINEAYPWTTRTFIYSDGQSFALIGMDRIRA